MLSFVVGCLHVRATLGKGDCGHVRFLRRGECLGNRWPAKRRVFGDRHINGLSIFFLFWVMMTIFGYIGFLGAFLAITLVIYLSLVKIKLI